MPPLTRLAVALSAVALLAACQPEPEAKYAKDLNSCELLPRETARRIMDVGPKLGPAEEKTWNFLVTYKYCQWTYKQPRDHFWSSYQKGPVKRQLTIRAEITTAESGGAPAVTIQYGGQLDADRKSGYAVQEVPGIGEAAFIATQKYDDGRESTKVKFRRSNALITLSLSGQDCCARQRGETDMDASKRRTTILAVAKAADHALLSR
ncbi:hypothetical protein GCM10029976_055260 [Kribbella albertanoniae]|uniref:DUF3558 domain-containing protein n=1 Tax=Kribbella albertanoniae TaxID=1266829 RepID=A0A4R4P0Y3_9ACTN|nr:hypothetical protein [Kribbella albertanoniae]TDC15174.1 hypothetical protein E1261_40820 [Kribbella albertanoniae]